jgi:L-galactose dehydrogenase
LIYRTLGRTGLQVSLVGFGASPLGNEFSVIDPDEGTRAVHAAIDMGINYFDVSPYYGRTLAESRLGEALAGRRDRVILATKAGRYNKLPPDGFDHSARRIAESLDESLRRLRTDYVDVFQLHDVEYADRAQICEESLPAMYRLRDAGKVRFVGITGYPLGVLREIAQTAPVDTILTYCRYDLLDTSLDDLLLPTAQALGLGLINASALHMALLTERGAPGWHPAPQRVHEAARRAAEHCRARGVDIADLALEFAFAHPYVSATLVGMSKVSHVERNVRLAGMPPDPALLAEVREILQPVANTVWQEGRPENDDPGAVPKGS